MRFANDCLRCRTPCLDTVSVRCGQIMSATTTSICEPRTATTMFWLRRSATATGLRATSPSSHDPGFDRGPLNRYMMHCTSTDLQLRTGWPNCVHGPTVHPTTGPTACNSVHTLQQFAQAVGPTAWSTAIVVAPGNWLDYWSALT
jgi:hypothetical protein